MSSLRSRRLADGPVLHVDGRGLCLADVVTTARDRGASTARLSEQALHRMRASDDLKSALVRTNTPIYGVTAGFGDSSKRLISGTKSAALQRNLINFLRCGSGPVADDDVVRATILIRANCLARGSSGVRPRLVELLLSLLEHDILPVIPERGSVGASGDLVPLSYLAAVLTGQGTVSYLGQRMPAGHALAAAGLTELELDAKEGLALVNGTSFMAAIGVLALHDARELAFAADLCTSLAVQVLQGNPGHFHPFIFAEKPHPGVVESARLTRQLIDGSPSLRDTGCTDVLGDGDDFRELGESLQDRYSVRCAPHVTGALRDALDWAERWLTTEINSTNDNPLFDAADRTVHAGGNFYGGHVGLAMDAVKIAVASVGDLIDRQLEQVVDERYSRGLTPNLIAPREPDDREAGVHHGFKGMQIASSALVAEALKNTMPATSFSRSTESHNQDKVSMATIAARDARTVIELVEHVVAIQLLALCQAADLRGGGATLSSAGRAVHELVREKIPFAERDRPMDQDVQEVAAIVRSGVLRETLAPLIPLA